jgi:hypothetical protein
VRYFFSRYTPPEVRILLVESGSRDLIERTVPVLRQIFGANVPIDLVTCYPGIPEGLHGNIFRIHDFGGGEGRHQLFAELSKYNYTVLGILCSTEPIMTKWKWWLALRLPTKLLTINENADFFFWDRAHLSLILHFILFRAGLAGASAVPVMIRFLLFPLTLGFLLLYAATVHLRRRFRLLWHRA